jgi:hypothetical protein
MATRKLILNMPDLRDPTIPITVLEDVTKWFISRDGTKSFEFEGQRWETDAEYAIQIED